jgi:hypothetical protein
MRHVAFDIDVLYVVDGVLEDAKQFRRDLVTMCYRRLDRFLFEPPVELLEAAQNLLNLHCSILP